MKRLMTFLPALAVLAAAWAWYILRAETESALRRRMFEQERAFSLAAPGSEGPASRGRLVQSPRASAHEPAPVLLTPGAVDEFLSHWTQQVLAEELRLVNTGETVDGKFPKTEEKFTPYRTFLKAVAPADLLALCLTRPGDPSISAWYCDVRSSDGQVRTLLVHAAFQELLARSPFLALQLPQLRPESGHEALTASVLGRCAREDADGAWRAVMEKYGGASAPALIIRHVLSGAAGGDVAARFQFARKWGLLSRVAGLWAESASQSRAGQEAWLAALQEAPPLDQEKHLLTFAREVEVSEGFAGVQRMAVRVAPAGSPLFDRILMESLRQDLEEAAAAKAEWALARISPANANDAAKDLMKHWAGTDPLAASEWLNTVPRSAPWRRAAVIAFAGAIEEHDPAAASQWRAAADDSRLP